MSRGSAAGIALLGAVALMGPVRATELPEQVGEWTRADHEEFVGGALYEHIDGGAELFHEYGFAALQVGYYRRGEEEILVEVYRMASPAAAHALFRYGRDPAAEALPAPYVGSRYELYLECLHGDELVKLAGPGPGAGEARLALLRGLIPAPVEPGALAGVGVLPEACAAGSEVPLPGPLALRNFAAAADGFPVGGEGALGAAGCRVAIGGEARRWVSIGGGEEALATATARWLEIQRRTGLQVDEARGATVVTDPLTGSATVVIAAPERVTLVPGLPAETASKTAARIRALATKGRAASP